jgi:hypothetical protein
VEPHIAAGRLHVVPGAPSFVYPVYAVCSARADDALVDLALAGLRSIAVSEQVERHI